MKRAEQATGSRDSTDQEGSCLNGVVARPRKHTRPRHSRDEVPRVGVREPLALQALEVGIGDVDRHHHAQAPRPSRNLIIEPKGTSRYVVVEHKE